MVTKNKEKEDENIKNEEEMDDGFDDGAADYALSNMLAELRGNENASGSIYRHQPQGKRLEFLFAFMPDEYESLGKLYEKVQSEFGGGTYRIQVRKDGRLVINRPVIIAEPLKKEEPKSNGFQEISQLIKSQNDEFKNLLILLMSKMQQPQQSAFNPVEMQAALMSNLIQMKEFLHTEKPSGVSEIDLVLKGLEIAKDLNIGQGESNSTDVLLEAIKTFGRPIAEITTKLSQTKKENINPSLSKLPPMKKEGQEMGNYLMKYYLNYLIQQAKKNSDPELYAELVLDNMPEGDVRLFVTNPNAFDKLIEINPAVIQYKVWFENLKEAILNIISENEEENKEENEISLTNIVTSAIDLNHASIDSSSTEFDSNVDPSGESGSSRDS